MKFFIYRTSEEIENGRTIEIDTLLDFLNYVNELKQPLIVDKVSNMYLDIFCKVNPEKYKEIIDCSYSIEVYDDYRE